MSSDRDYMRSEYRTESTSVLTWLLCAMGSAYILQFIFARWFGSGLLETVFTLSTPGIRSGFAWQLLSYSFLHDRENLLHIVCNGLAIYFFGREILARVTPKQFLGLYFGSILIGALVWTATHFFYGGAVIGASAAACSFLTVFALLYPDRQITFLLFFFIPVTMKPKYLAWFAFGVDMLFFLFYEIMGQPSPAGLAHSAHLGGMLAGYLFYRTTFVNGWSFNFSFKRTAIENPAWSKKARQAGLDSANFKVNISPRSEDLKAEVDRILDKINSQGFGALTKEEKKLLDDARDHLNRR